MGIGGMSIGSLILILLIALVIFGAKRLRNVGSDLGAAVRSFKNAADRDQQNGPKSAETVQSQ